MRRGLGRGSFEDAWIGSGDQNVEIKSQRLESENEKAEEFVTQDDWAFISNELANLALHISEGPESSDEVSKEKDFFKHNRW